MSSTRLRMILRDFIVLFLSLGLALLAAEGILRFKNSNMKNYDIEMWRYSNELKEPSPNASIGHIHKKNASAILQSVKIRTNSLGLRGDDSVLACCDKTVLFLGSSITLGWGVSEEATLTEVLNQKFDNKVGFLNGGIGNYNTVRYVNNFLLNLKPTNPNIIVVQYFINDAEKLSINRGNFFLKSSQLAVTLWSVFQKTKANLQQTSLEDHYEKIYDPKALGFTEMQGALDQLMFYARKNDIRVILAMTPDIHSMNPYSFGYIHDTMEQEALNRGFEYVDLLKPLQKVAKSENIFAMPGDPHPNATGHRLMAEEIHRHLKKNAL